MFRNFLKIVFRNLWRYKGYTLINIIGMGIGIAAMVWGYQTYKFSYSYDNFHKDRDHVYRALTYKKDAEGMKGIVPMAAVLQAPQDFSGIKEAVRWDSRGANIKYDKSDAFAEQVHFTDPAFFDLFNFPLVKGSNNITDHSSILITEKTAKKYFASQDPIGKTLILYAGETYAMPLTVAGILKDVPVNSTIKFDFITNFENQLKGDGTKIATDDWKWFVDAAFFRVADKANAQRVEKEMNKYLAVQNTAREDWKVSAFKFISIKEAALISERVGSNSLYERPEDSATYGPFILAFLIFLSACLNFSNTTVARANRRLKEIGMRKVMGSTHAQLIRQLLFECSVIVFAAVLLSMLLNNWWLPVFNQMFNAIDVKADYLNDRSLIIFLICILAGATLLAGSYPAFYVSRFNPTAIFRGSIKFGGTNLFSRLMLGLQLSIAIITVVAGIAFARNAEYQRNYDFGYSMENAMGVTFFDSTSYVPLKNELSKIPEIKSLSGTRHHIAFSFRNAVAEAEQMKKETNFLEVGKDYLKTMQLKLAVGRDFNPTSEAEYDNALLITQKLAAQFGWKEKEALGKRIYIDSAYFSVVGILNDFHPDHLFNPMEPVAMKLVKESRFQFLIMQAKAEDLTTAYGKVQDAWKRLFPLKPFNGFYQNQITVEAYNTSNSIATIFKWFAIVSILLTATGLFALVSLTTLKKTKEIAVRKVAGAAPHHIMVLINKSYFWIFIVSALLGCYGGYALTKLLLDLIFKINAGVTSTTLIGAVAALFIIAAFVTGIKVWQAVRTNPVKMLRTE
jgi:putative ABC transport system permease protein